MQANINVNSKIKDRLLKFIKLKSISVNQFHKNIGVGNGYLSKVTSIGSDIIESIVENYPEINVEWLITGDGSILKKEPQTDMEVKEPYETYGNRKGIPVIPQSAQAGFNTFDISVYSKNIDQYLNVPVIHEKADFAIKIEGDSMSPRYTAGTYIICKNITGITEVRWERVYLILVNHAPMLKRIYPSQNGDTIILRSDNPLYRDIEVLRSDINSIAQILATIYLEN